MYRDIPNTGINPDVMGVGSVVCGGSTDSQHESYLVVGDLSKTHVALIDNNTYVMVSPWVQVENINYLSSSEMRELVNPVGAMLNWTFTDFFMSTRGMKSTSFKKSDAR